MRESLNRPLRRTLSRTPGTTVEPADLLRQCWKVLAKACQRTRCARSSVLAPFGMPVALYQWHAGLLLRRSTYALDSWIHRNGCAGPERTGDRERPGI